ncbi:glycosyl hydrolase family 3 N terminal domain-containing protein [Zychaea mexicana]|uniref:glycosyl hydrolase family 3 N terminal domain-containing protein n=1 Tax=Zychaea mexicana TaxID=64656 RepID=UPI0022FEA583|nr:glycosyl hydrolase family 3 N terminal domain-containing protein [Zychaea mexicana]KAI9491546.1 glycosyl hydrolase family 3 N terminal domain-containing protein [Zychaea mexicana]
MIRQRGVDIAQEFRGKGINIWLGPSADLLRIPRAGRNWESFGEDPVLSGIAVSETIKGAQSQGVIATVKHYAVYNQETFREHMSSNIDERTLQELYLWPIARAVEAQVGSVMCAYNKINNVYACENDELLSRILRDEMGFRGCVQSDWGATHSTAKAANAGLDMEMMQSWNAVYFGDKLRAAVDDGKVSNQRLNLMVERIVATYYKFGQDKDYPVVQINTANPSKDPGVNVQGNHKDGIRKIGAASTVLLRNDGGILPLRGDKLSEKRIVVAGTDAGAGLLPPNLCPLHMCDTGTTSMGGGSGSAYMPYLVTPLQGITERAKKEAIQVQAILQDVSPVSDLLTIISTTVSPTDTCIVFGSAYSMEAFDRPIHGVDPLDVPIIEHISNVCENTVLVIHAIGPIDLPFADHPNIKAIVWAGLPGQETGNSLADILFGDVNPSGRLPYTIAKQHQDYPADVSLKLQVPYNEKLLLGYRWFDAKGIDPLFEFGFGLSYTTFTYGQLAVNVIRGEKPEVEAHISIRNSGKVDGAEVVQAYLSFPASVGEPPKVLRGFEKIFLTKDEQKPVTFLFSKQDLSIWDTKGGGWIVPSPGTFTLHVGASSRDIRSSTTFEL